jgi:hypothetical protein
MRLTGNGRGTEPGRACDLERPRALALAPAVAAPREHARAIVAPLHVSCLAANEGYRHAAGTRPSALWRDMVTVGPLGFPPVPEGETAAVRERSSWQDWADREG